MAERYLSEEEPRMPELFTLEGYEGVYVMDAVAVYAYRNAMRAYAERLVDKAVQAALCGNDAEAVAEKTKEKPLKSTA